MKFLMYETSALSIKTGGTARFREMWEYLSEHNLADLYACSRIENNSSQHMVQLQDVKRGEYPFFRFKFTRIAWKNKKTIKNINKEDYTSVISFDVPATIGIAMLGVKNICLMVRKDLLEYKKIALENEGASKIKIKFWMAYLLICEAVCISRSKKIIVQCKYDYDCLIKRHRLQKRTIEKKTSIQINNVNPSWTVRNFEALNSTELPEVNKDYFNVCCVCNFNDKRKGADIILAAFSSLFANKEGYTLYMIGDGCLLSAFKKQYSKICNIVFLGNMRNPMEIVSQCTLAVVPSRADSCPNTVFEPMYIGVPVIATNVGGIPEILNDDEALFSPDAESLKSKLGDVVSNKKIYNRLLSNQRARKEELTFDWVDSIIKIILGDKE